jgi:membrane fusion protein (multidrug efflux system)
MTDIAPSTPPSPEPNPWRRRLIAIALIVLCLAVGAWLFLPGLFRAETDDAYVEAHIETISARVPGYVQSLAIDDNSQVRKGDMMIELDPRDYRTRMDKAAADLAATRSRLEEAKARSAVADTQVGVAASEADAASANARLAADDLQRFAGVSDVRAVSSQRVDTARAGAETARATLAAARHKVELAHAEADLASAQVKTAEANMAQAKAAFDQAGLDLSYTHVAAPETGSVANKLIEQGAYVQAGQTLLSLVPAMVYVVANFKETQIEGIEAGRPVVLHVDALPDLVLHGHVDSIQRGSGSRFALLPPENATGNFVKIVQRLPVKIIIDEPPETMARLAPGMSAVVSIRYSHRPFWHGMFG